MPDKCPDLSFSESPNKSISPTDILVQSAEHMGICTRRIRCAESHCAIHFVIRSVIWHKHLRFSRFQNPASKRPTGMVNQDGQPESSIRTVNQDGQPGWLTRTANRDGRPGCRHIQTRLESGIFVDKKSIERREKIVNIILM